MGDILLWLLRASVCVPANTNTGTRREEKREKNYTNTNALDVLKFIFIKINKKPHFIYCPYFTVKLFCPALNTYFFERRKKTTILHWLRSILLKHSIHLVFFSLGFLSTILWMKGNSKQTILTLLCKLQPNCVLLTLVDLWNVRCNSTSQLWCICFACVIETEISDLDSDMDLVSWCVNNLYVSNRKNAVILAQWFVFSSASSSFLACFNNNMEVNSKREKNPSK